jgi:uncharacterized protein (DUF1501 family)
MEMTRRNFVGHGILALTGVAAVPSFLHRERVDLQKHSKRLVFVFQRGGADGLNMVVPHGETAYYRLRPSIAIPKNSVIDLDGFFGFHPAMSSFKPLWDRRHLAIVHAAGSPAAPPCHIAAQSFAHSGNIKSDESWLTRALHALPKPATSVYDPSRSFAASLRQIAGVLKSDPHARVAYAELSGWDHHANQGGIEGPFSDLLHDFSRSLITFWNELGELQQDTVIVTMSEFGRSVRENDRGGTDHGQGGVMLIFGGPVQGGRVFTRWPGLADGPSGRNFLRATTDFRTVLTEVIGHHLGCREVEQLFPGFADQTSISSLVGSSPDIPALRVADPA